MADVFRILSIDGGGIRGIVPATVLRELERRAGAPASELFDLIAGTSTGGIIALGVTKPSASGRPQFTAGDLVALYENEGRRIFSQSLLRRIHAAGSALEEKYSADGLEEVLAEYFGDARLKDALTDVLVPSYEIERRIPWFFRSRKARVDAAYDFAMSDVARATSAAPTFFDPARLDAAGGDYWALVDGGVYANNPTMCAYAEKMDVDRDADVLVVSLGTGTYEAPIAYDDAADWGRLGWARPILDVVFDGVSDTVAYQVAELCPPRRDGSKRYFRFQLRVDATTDAMDDASKRNVWRLKRMAEGLVRERETDLDAVSNQLERLRERAGSARHDPR